ncbi:hypothetical protein CHS0354_028763 [Potamilus streckersoni]|uniref:TIR domain-containing protein n=1 Tax=Potamilus streckersoni TaxID=2493646 RepID=A0AAE0VSD3_9BIVA|nr:hypothetical protein CHS0354_028763 [Potamilus streckersoni]
MEVDVIIHGQLTNNAVLRKELQNHDNTTNRRTLSKNKIYHVFFCYRDVPNDKLWVKEAVEKLENDYGFICCDHERDFLPGTKIMDNIKYGIKNSEKVVAVLSKEGLDSEYLRLETEMAHREGIDKRENLLIPVLLENCEIPEELKLLTYIDARKEINERIWWPKLIAAIESKEVQPTFYLYKLCSLETTFSCKQCSIQSTSKYIPTELISKDEVVPVETIKSLKRDLLDVPKIRWKQRCCGFVNGCLVFCLIILVGVIVLDILVANGCATSKMVNTGDCFLELGICLIIEITVGICCIFGWKCYYKDPRSLDKKIIEYNTELIKNGMLITLVSESLWKSASIIFFRVSIEMCKKYVLFHLREDRKMETDKSVNISGIETQHDADDVSPLTESGNENLVQATEKYVETSELQAEHDADDVPLLNISANDDPTQTNKTLLWRHNMKVETKTFVDASDMQEQNIAEDVPLLAVSENEQLNQPTEVYQRNLGQHHMADDQGSTIVNLNDQENESQQSQNSHLAQNSDLGHLENVAMTLLLKYAHEYLRLALKGKMNNPKEDRHKADYMCLCQYIERTDKKFRKLVDRNKDILAKSSSIEHITENKQRDAFRL